MVIFFGNWRTE
jgi:Txe/YoeB family toxin of Txe-Axe toxin-antitoxin module